MKKDKKFLEDLENQLNGISKKKRNAIVLKYRNLIDEELGKKRKIKEIIKELGKPEEVAQKEIQELKVNKKVDLSKFKDALSNIGSNISNGFKKFYKGITKDIQLKSKDKKEEKVQEEKSKKVKEDKLKKIKEEKTKKDKPNKERNKKEKEKKQNKNKGITNKIKSFFKKKKEKNIVEEVIEEVEESFDDMVEEVSEVAEIISNKPIFMSKAERRKQIILRTLGLLVLIVLIIVWLWINIIFVASLFAVLDGIKLYGINVTLFGISLLVFWVIIMFNRLVFKKKNRFKLNIAITLIAVLIIAVGVAYSANQLSKIDIESDVSQKYNMTTKYDTYNLPSNEEKMYIIFNANYDTQYIIKYDDKLEGKFKVEVKYYENYYDYYVKKSTNNIYISLSKDTRDRISAYIDDFKENKIYKQEELSRYTVKITINEKDYQRLVIEN